MLPEPTLPASLMLLGAGLARCACRYWPGSTSRPKSPAALIERYAARWSIEQAFHDTRQHPGGGQARNRVCRAVERTIPFTMIVHTLIIIW